MNELLDNNFLENKSINKILEKIIEKKAISNAYIFYGPDKIGKKEYALKFISKIIELNNLVTNTCSKIRENNHPDYLLIEPTYLLKGNLINESEVDSETKQKNKPLIRIDQIRNIRNFLSEISAKFYKLINEVPTIFMIIIILLVVLKPNLG